MRYKNEIIVLALCAVFVALGYVRTFRWDLTDDRLYSLSPASKELLRSTDEPIDVTLYLQGDLNSGFRRLKKATEELKKGHQSQSPKEISKDFKEVQ